MEVVEVEIEDGLLVIRQSALEGELFDALLWKLGGELLDRGSCCAVG